MKTIKFFSKFKIHILIVLGAFYVLSSLFLVYNYDRKKAMHSKEVETLIIREFDAALKSYELIAKEFYERVVNRPEVFSLMNASLHNPQQDDANRKILFGLTRDPYQQSGEIFAQFHFFKADGTTLLRVHNPKKFGDNVSGERPLVRKALQSQSYVNGYEEGRAGGGFRYLYPLFQNDMFLGLAEVGVSAETALAQLEAIHTGTYEIIFHKTSHEKMMLPDIRSEYQISELSAQYLFAASHRSALLEQLHKEMEPLGNRLENPSPFTLFFSFDKSIYHAVFIPIKGNGEEPSGWIVRYEQDPFMANEKLHLIQLLGGLTLLFFGFGIFAEYQIRQRKELQQSNNLLQQYLKAIDAGSIISKGDLSGNIIYVNEQLCKTTGYTAQELIGKPHNIFRHPQTPKETFRAMWSTIQSGHIFRGLVRNLKKDGSPFYAQMTVIPILDDEGTIIEYIAFRDDVTELIQQQEAMEQAFSTDSLTNLGNRFKLLNDLKDIPTPALAVVNIDRFREINDFYGNKIGDFVIIELSNRLFDHIYGQKAKLYRIHADEFGILADTAIFAQPDFYQKIVNILQEIHKKPLIAEGNEIHFNVTCGIAYGYRDIVHADLALKTAKRKRETIVVFDEQLKTGDEYRNNLLWTGKIRKGLEEDRFLPYFQPIVDNRTRTVSKYECLIRLNDQGTVVSPYAFLDVSKKAKLYTHLTQTVIRKSFAAFAPYDFEFSINLTVEDIMDVQLRLFLEQELERFACYGKVIFEIVESEGIECLEEVKNFIRIMKSKGCRIAIDDFGTGYSNFDYLIKLQADFIKIDGSLIKQIVHDANSCAVVETIIQFAKKQHIKTVAEFVSDESIAKKVIELGIDYSQGYYYGAPAEAIGGGE